MPFFSHQIWYAIFPFISVYTSILQNDGNNPSPNKWFPCFSLPQGGPLPVVSRVITPCKWPYSWVTGVITPLISGRGSPCRSRFPTLLDRVWDCLHKTLAAQHLGRRKVAENECIFFWNPMNQLMVNCWFEARWFGFLESPKMKWIVTGV